MQLTITIPDELDARVLEAFGSPPPTMPIHVGPHVPATKAEVEERLKNYLKQQLYAYEDNLAMIQTMRERSEQTW
jgi:hypothetical protein